MCVVRVDGLGQIGGGRHVAGKGGGRIPPPLSYFADPLREFGDVRQPSARVSRGRPEAGGVQAFLIRIEEGVGYTVI